MTRFRFMTLFILLLIPTGANGAETGEWTPLHEAAADGGGGGGGDVAATPTPAPAPAPSPQPKPW